MCHPKKKPMQCVLKKLNISPYLKPSSTKNLNLQFEYPKS